ncbi:MAG: GxxExxY protein [Bacteroidaceae bacterium]|nr:GxxExxY protein [Bacteroidaceae bacterium]
MDNNYDLTGLILKKAYEVHTSLGPGLLESTYEECLCYELSLIGLQVERQKSLPIEYKGIKIDNGYRLDIVVENKVVIELKSVETLLPIHTAQLLTYLKLSHIKYGLLINFNVKSLKEGIKRYAM